MLKIEVAESADQLKEILEKQPDVTRGSNGQLTTPQLLRTPCPQDSATVVVEDSSGESNQSMGSLEWLPSHHTSWLSKSRQGGLDALLEVRPKPGRPTTITGKIRQQLVRVLQDSEGFSSNARKFKGGCKQWVA